MACRAVEIWTTISLIGAYLDLALASLFLVGATVAFLTSKVLSIFGLSLPCSCDGHFGHPACAQTSVLLDFPASKIAGVRRSLISRFPCDSFLSSNSPSRICRHAVRIQHEDDGSSSTSFLSRGSRSRSLPTPSTYQRRCRRRAEGSILGLAKFSSDSRFRVSGAPWIAEQKESDLADETANGEKKLFNGVECESDCYEEDGIDTKRSFEKEVDEERGVVLLALYSELEKERSAAATAADEAMSMILRLQNEKAEIEMNARQYQRMIEEKSAYDEEEMEILKKIIVRHEMEKHALEKEVEMYKRTMEDSQSCLKLQFHGDVAMIRPLDLSTGEKQSLQFSSGADFQSFGNLNSECEESKSFETKSIIRDVHMVSDGQIIQFDENGEQNIRFLERGSPINFDESDPNNRKSYSETAKRIELMRNFRRQSLPSVKSERFKLETDVEHLRKRLKMIRQERERLNLFAGHGEKENFQLQVLEEKACLHSEVNKASEPNRNFRRASSTLTMSSFESLLESATTSE